MAMSLYPDIKTVSLTFPKCRFIHLVKVLFCTFSRSTRNIRNKETDFKFPEEGKTGRKFQKLMHKRVRIHENLVNKINTF